MDDHKSESSNEGEETGTTDEEEVNEDTKKDDLFEGGEYIAEEYEGEGESYISSEVLPPESFQHVDSTERTTPEGESYEGETTFYFEGEEEGEEYAQQMGEYQEEDEDLKSESSMSQIYSKLSPFFAKWAYGIKTSTKLINLTKDGQNEVFYSASHFGVLYNYRTNSMRFLPGHNSSVSSIAADASGRWLVTADGGKEDNVIIIWDHDRQLPCWSLFNIFPGKGTKCVQISQDARFLAAVSGDTPQRCKFFLWTYGRDEADGEIEMDSGYGNVASIQFNHMETTQFAITMDTRIMFCQWISDKKILENFLTGIKKRKGKFGNFRETVFLDDDHTAVTSTSCGHIVVWTDNLNIDPKESTKGTIKKKYVKTIRIHKSGITSLLIVDGSIVTSSDEGIISFHDQTLSLLYYVPRYQVEPIVCVSSNLQEQIPSQNDPFSESFNDGISPGTSSEDIQDLVEESNDEKTSEEDAKPQKLTAPSDYTIDMKPFYMRDLMFLTWNGRIGYVSHRRGKVRYFLFGFGATVISMDCNPNVPHLVMGNSAGRVDLFNYKTRLRLVSNAVTDSGIVTLKYSPTGRYLMAGLANGAALLLDPLLLTLKMKIHVGKAPIQKFCFTLKEKMFAYYDKDNTVYLCKIIGEKSKSKKCIFMGGYKSHYKPIRDILFDEEYDPDEREKDPRLYTIGEDRIMVEYDVRNSQPGMLKLKRTDRIEQTAIPECFTLMPRFGKRPAFLIANSEYKFKVVCRDTRVCCKTTLGPTGDTPPNFMKVIPGFKSKLIKMIYATERHIGLRLLPSTGNPYEGMGMIAHPEKITSIAISHDYKYVFTVGSHDTSVLAWKVNSPSVEIAYQLGGIGLEPFMTLIEGGTDGFLYKEMEDFFYYSQIIHQGEHANVDRCVTKSLALCEIPDLVRALGYFPTEYEIDNIIREVKYEKFEETGELINEISFDECVKIYLNHRPVNGISLESINKALVSVADLSDPECIIIEKDELYKSLEERGEKMSHAEVVGYLCILLLPKNEKDPVPAAMTLKDFADDVLGIDLTITEDNVKEIIHPSDNK